MPPGRIAIRLFRRSDAKSRTRTLRPRFDSLETRALLTSLPTGFSGAVVASGLNRPTAMDSPPSRQTLRSGAGRHLACHREWSAPRYTVCEPERRFQQRAGTLGVAFDPNSRRSLRLRLLHGSGVAGAQPREPLHRERQRCRPGSEVDPVRPRASSMPPITTEGRSTSAPTASSTWPWAKHGLLQFPDARQPDGQDPADQPDGSIPERQPVRQPDHGRLPGHLGPGPAQPVHLRLRRPAGTGRMFINDVGENAWEEIDDGIAGANYGWPLPRDRHGPGLPCTALRILAQRTERGHLRRNLR